MGFKARIVSPKYLKDVDWVEVETLDANPAPGKVAEARILDMVYYPGYDRKERDYVVEVEGAGRYVVSTSVIIRVLVMGRSSPLVTTF